ncbi:MAG: AroM family protein [Desulfobacterales bacterium]|jgi:protein AroM
MKKQIGIVTIGQSPRSDVVPEIQTHLGDHVTVIEHGALDGLEPAEVKAYAPEPGMLPLVTRMQDGTEVIVAKEKLLPRLDDVMAVLDDKGVDMILLLCNGDFPVFNTRCLVIEPQRLVDGCLSGLLRERHRLGVLVPVPEQEIWVRQRLGAVNPNLTVAVASPYEGQKPLEVVCQRFRDEGCDLIVLYCMGFNRQLGEKVRALCSSPVIVSSTVVARILGELLEV